MRIENKRNRSGRSRAERGFSLIEAMIALTVLSFGMLGVYSLHNYAIRNNKLAARATEASYLAEQAMDQLLRLTFTPDVQDPFLLPSGDPDPTDITDPVLRHADYANSLDGPSKVNRLGNTNPASGPLHFRRTFRVEDVPNVPEQVRILVRVSFEDRAVETAYGYPKHSITLAATRTWDGDSR